MDFHHALDDLSAFLDAHGIRWALIGGVALAAYGLARTTLDLDLVVDADAQDAVIAHLETSGYETLHRSAGYSNHLHPDPRRGRIDFVYVRGATREALFAAAEERPGLRGRKIPVPRPEHLAAMKILAMHNDPARRLQDLADLRHLAALPGVDREEIRRYFERYDLLDAYEELARELPPPRPRTRHPDDDG